MDRVLHYERSDQSILERFDGDHYNSHVFELVFTETARRQYSRLNPRLRKQVDRGMERIAANPRAGKPLGGSLKGIWSERVATFRILYKILEERIEVLVLVIEHRKSVYGGH
jgi:mRNA-degrading endonuclease RelE of RelBE toxin-antitoxin system